MIPHRNNKDFEEQISTLYAKNLKGTKYVSRFDGAYNKTGIKPTLFELENLEQLEKMGRMKLKGWEFNIVNLDEFIQKTKIIHQILPTIIYFRLFQSKDTSWINE